MKYIKQLTSEIETFSEKFKTMVELYIDRELKDGENIHVNLYEDKFDFYIQINLNDEGSSRIYLSLSIYIYYDCRDYTYTYTMGSLDIERENDKN